MTKEDIYTKLGYNGKYDTKIKTNLRNMIKENKDNDEICSLLKDVQNDLETGKAKVFFNRMNKKDVSISNDKDNNPVEEDDISDIQKEKTKKTYVKKETKKKKKTTKKKKKKSLGSVIGKILIILFVLLMIASSVSTIFSYFR